MEPKCKGVKYWSNNEYDGGIAWAIFSPEVTDVEIKNKYPEYHGHPGQPFAHRVWIQRTNTKTLAKQMFGYDV